MGEALADRLRKAMKGFVWVDPASCDARGLRRWVELAENYVGKLPSKETK